MVDEAVDHGGDYDVVAEDLSPATEGFESPLMWAGSAPPQLT